MKKIFTGPSFIIVYHSAKIDSALPGSSSFTLVDLLHGFTLFFILAIIAANAYSLKLFKSNNVTRSYKFDTIAAQTMLFIYIVLNAWFILKATKG